MKKLNFAENFKQEIAELKNARECLQAITNIMEKQYQDYEAEIEASKEPENEPTIAIDLVNENLNFFIIYLKKILSKFEEIETQFQKLDNKIKKQNKILKIKRQKGTLKNLLSFLLTLSRPSIIILLLKFLFVYLNQKKIKGSA